MIKIYKSQLDAFASISLRNFEGRMVKHLQCVFRDECEQIGETGIRKIIQHGMERSQHYGIVLEYDICLYLHVMLVLGEHFDEEPKFTWARAVLDDNERGASSRIDHLHDLVFQTGK
jgi:hypothetical protein